MGKHDRNEKIEKTENIENLENKDNMVKRTKTKKVEKNEKRKSKILLKIIIVAIFLALVIGVLYLASHNYIRDDITDKTNLIINNSNVTTINN